MSWNYDLFDHLRYEYPNESPGPERPSDPPIPPDGWPLPRVGEVIPVGEQNDDRFTPFKARVIGVEWDYAVPRVTVQLEVVRDLVMPRPLPQINALVTDEALDAALAAGQTEYRRRYQLVHDPGVVRLVDAAVELALEAAAPLIADQALRHPR